MTERLEGLPCRTNTNYQFQPRTTSEPNYYLNDFYMENLAIYTTTQMSQLDPVELFRELQRVKYQMKLLREEKSENRSTIRQQQNTIANQARTIRELNNETIKLLKEQKVELNKDKYTFEQFFNLKCRNRTVFKHLQMFMKVKPTWDNLTTSKLEQFNIWIRTNAGVKESSAANYIIQLKNVIKQGYLNGSDTSVALRSEKAPKEKKIWLKPAELRKVLQYEPTDADEIYVHKLFVICCLTGCRISDAVTLKPENIDGNTLRYIPIKTKYQECYVQLSEKVKSVLLYFIQKEATPTNKKENDILKNIFRKLKLNRKMEIGTPNNPNIVQICDAVHFHSARHSFATIKFRYSNWSERQIATAIGHSSFNMTLENYVCDISPVSDQEKVDNYDELFN